MAVDSTLPAKDLNTEVAIGATTELTAGTTYWGTVTLGFTTPQTTKHSTRMTPTLMCSEGNDRGFSQHEDSR